MNIALWLERTAKANPAGPALGHGLDITATYGELAANTAARAGALLTRHGLVPGDRVAIVAGNSPRYVKALYAIWHAGLVAVPVNAKLHGLEIAWILENAGVRAAFVSPDLETVVSAHAPPTVITIIAFGSADWSALSKAEPIPVVPRAASDLAWLFYTSGTTGRPKGAMLSHGNLSAMSQAYALEVDPILPGNPILHAAPMSHGSGLYIMAHVMRGGINVVPESGGFEPAEIAATMNHWRAMSMFAAPTMIKRLVASGSRFESGAIRTIIWGGAPMYVEDTRAALEHLGPCLAQIYGLGESPMTITTLPRAEIADHTHPRWLDRLGSGGRAYACIEATVADAEGHHLPPGETGEVICRGNPVMLGYWNNEAATAKSLRDGWLFTGDVGAFDAHGYLVLKDRANDLIISGGSNIYPREVEEVLLEHPGVREVSVIGRKDADWGEVVVAFIVGDAPPQELDALCLARIARFKRPKDYVTLDALPKSNYGKILKIELRKLDLANQERRMNQ
ncbi:MAG: class I adenylate-forming enzyme family protein [Bosea sp. (in: a-proteobacteria)]